MNFQICTFDRFLRRALLLLALVVATNGAFAIPPEVVGVSTTLSGQFGDDHSECPAVSADARFIAFESLATNLSGLPSNGHDQILLKDIYSGLISLITIGLNGHESNGSSFGPTMSAEGRYIAFSSIASNLVQSDTNNSFDVFVFDRQSMTMTRESLSTLGMEGNGDSIQSSISGDGRFVVFESHANNLVDSDLNACSDIFLRDRLLQTTIRVSKSVQGVEGNGTSLDPAISASGGFIVFESFASNLVSNDSNGARDIFIWKSGTGVISRASVTSAGGQANNNSYDAGVSDNGRFVTYHSRASNLVSGDTNRGTDIFVRDTEESSTVRVSVSTSGDQGNGFSQVASISGDGRFVAYESDSTNLISGDDNGIPDLFVRDRSRNQTYCISRSILGDMANRVSVTPSLSRDGSSIVFASYASNLIDRESPVDVSQIYLFRSRAIPKRTQP